MLDNSLLMASVHCSYSSASAAVYKNVAEITGMSKGLESRLGPEHFLARPIALPGPRTIAAAPAADISRLLHDLQFEGRQLPGLLIPLEEGGANGVLAHCRSQSLPPRNRCHSQLADCSRSGGDHRHCTHDEIGTTGQIDVQWRSEMYIATPSDTSLRAHLCRKWTKVGAWPCHVLRRGLKACPQLL